MRKLLKQHFIPSCKKYLGEIVEELNKLGNNTTVHTNSEGAYAAYSDESPGICLVINTHNQKHSNCWLKATIGHPYNPLKDDIIKSICREKWGDFYFDVTGEVIGLNLIYPGRSEFDDVPAVYISPRKLAEDLKFVLKQYTKLKEKKDEI